MKGPAFLLILGCLAAVSAAPAQEKTVPEFTALKDQFDAKVKLEVQQPYDLGVVDLNVKYTAALDRALEAAQRSGKLEEALAIKEDKEAVALGKGVPATDDAKTPLAVKQLRGTYRVAISRLEVERVRRLQPLQTAFVRSLDALVTSLTKEGNLDGAMAVKKHREELAAAVPAPARVTLGQLSSANSSHATKDAPLANSLGMKFVPVPDTGILMCIHETRRADYAAYSAANPGVNSTWQNMESRGIPCGKEDSHPVVGVSYEDAVAFCSWLSKTEGRTYRLPTDREWSIAVGLGHAEKWTAETTPAALSQKEQTEFPWGRDFPPKTRDKVGNYGDMEGYSDGFETTAPVMSFKPNKLGIYDLGGNVWEWVEDWFTAGHTERALRGGAWTKKDRDGLLSSNRDNRKPNDRGNNHGFRCVLVVP